MDGDPFPTSTFGPTLAQGSVFGVSSMDLSLETCCRPTGSSGLGRAAPGRCQRPPKGQGCLRLRSQQWSPLKCPLKVGLSTLPAN